MAVITGRYIPKIRSSVEPEIPGRIIAQIAAAPQMKTYKYITKPGLLKSIIFPPPTGLKYVMTDTSAMPVITKNILLIFSFRQLFSSIITIEIAKIINPMNNEEI